MIDSCLIRHVIRTAGRYKERLTTPQTKTWFEICDGIFPANLHSFHNLEAQEQMKQHRKCTVGGIHLMDVYQCTSWHHHTV